MKKNSTIDQIDFNPESNKNVISIIRQEDGNYIGYTQRNGGYVTVRQGDPSTVLSLLLTHP